MDKEERFYEWLKNRGCKDFPGRLVLREFPVTGRGLSAQVPIDISESIVNIPQSAVVSIRGLQEADVELYGHPLQGLEPLQVWLLMEMFLRPQSDSQQPSVWQPWLDMYPDPSDFVSMPVSFSDQQIAGLALEFQGPAKEHRKFYLDQVPRLVRALSKRFPLELVRKCVEEHGVYVFCCVNSRCVFTGVRNGYDDFGLVPGFDMLNMDPQVSMDKGIGWGTSPGNGETTFQVFVSNRMYSVGDQVFINYSNGRDDWELIKEYGFALGPHLNPTALEVQLNEPHWNIFIEAFLELTWGLETVRSEYVDITKWEDDLMEQVFVPGSIPGRGRYNSLFRVVASEEEPVPWQLEGVMTVLSMCITMTSVRMDHLAQAMWTGIDSENLVTARANCTVGKDCCPLQALLHSLQESLDFLSKVNHEEHVSKVALNVETEHILKGSVRGLHDVLRRYSCITQQQSDPGRGRK
eukprot:Clim_evm71s225 gene=Clim_evmTU71s225